MNPETHDMKNPFFITFEGIDFSGKSVQCKLLLQWLLTFTDAVLCRDPGTTQISEKIRVLLLSRENHEMSPWTELLLYEAARAQMVQEIIRPALSAGKAVICDRFYDSTTAYQGYARDLDLDTIQAANRIGSCDMVPDVTFFLDIEPEIAMARQKNDYLQDRLEVQGIQFQKAVRLGYLQIAQAEPNRIKVVNGQRDIDSVHHEIIHILQSQIRNKT
jgi:dTMP kinase